MATSSDYISVLHLTDPHIRAKPEDTLLGVNTAYYFNAVLECAFASGQSYDLCLLTGDLAQDPCKASYQYILDRLQTHHTPCICLPGNHDVFSIMRAVFNLANINCIKHKILGKWQIIALNSQIPGANGGYLAAEELGFLTQTLNEYSDLYTLIAIHHHCLPTESRWMDTMIVQNAQALFDAVKPYPAVKIIIHGHIHQAIETQLESVKVLATPSTCFQFKPKSVEFDLDNLSPGYRSLKLYNDGIITSEVVRIPETLCGIEVNSEGY